jgi:nucleotidyltransferase substrate binding protein (TIGR01987 family)
MSNFSEDIRWKQRFDNYNKAYIVLTSAVDLAAQRPLSDLESQGLIQGFEFTHELSWKLLKDYLEAQGFMNLIGSKNAVRTAFNNGLIDNGDVWMEMIEARNKTSHLYNQSIITKIADDILHLFYPELGKLVQTFKALAVAQQNEA